MNKEEDVGRETSHLGSVGTHSHDCKVPLAMMDPARISAQRIE